MFGWIGKLARNARGATAMEYGLVVALIAIGLTAGVSTLGARADALWHGASTRVAGAIG
ncbi:Flp family type IVb pilin [Sphingomonas sp.]|uniref:Flp family type IVb pilin n=1 Tax=Sphingomonas sp. TaxID=28214 RepID=UPI003B3B4E7D